MAVNNKYLFSIDLEDVRLNVPNGTSYENRVSINTHKYLKWLKKYDVKCTFFCTGHAVKLCPELIREIIEEGHEIGCHTTNHIPLIDQSPLEFKKDLEENILILKDAGAKNIEGFRAPVFSLTKETQWAYPILEELGFLYSSSVLPAKNPLFGWQEFGEAVRTINNVVEIPVSVDRLGPLVIPSAGGVYFRILPFFVTRRLIKKREKGLPLVGYFHPYDIDVDQERFMHSGINNSFVYNQLMYYNRKNMFKKLDQLMSDGYEISTYIDYVKSLKE